MYFLLFFIHLKGFDEKGGAKSVGKERDSVERSLTSETLLWIGNNDDRFDDMVCM